MSPTDNDDDPSFLALPARLKHRIDDAFDSTASPGMQLLQQSGFEDAAGGFTIGSEPGPPEYEAGGFIVEGVPLNSCSTHFYIPLSKIPCALILLDLSPDDDIMEVFKNATTGWGAWNGRNDGVSKRDWRAVCAVLLEGEGSDGENRDVDEDVEISDDSGPDNDEYQMDELSDEREGDSSGEYEEASQAAPRTRKAQVSQAKSSGTEVSMQLTESQKVQCLQDFGRFFPHVPGNELEHQRIMIKDITRVADVLKEHLKTEDILEMLEAFSTSPDKSMNLADFERMMILTKLV